VANLLTSTTSRSSYIYGVIVVIFGFLFLYLWYFKDPTIKRSFNERAFIMSAQALENSVRLANIKFLSKGDNRVLQDIWIENGTGLDFNDSGFPIGTNSLNFNENLPITLSSCKEIWDFFMGALQPIANAPNEENFWAEVDQFGRCNYLSYQLVEKKIVYDTTIGKVAIEDHQIEQLNN